MLRHCVKATLGCDHNDDKLTHTPDNRISYTRSV